MFSFRNLNTLSFLLGFNVLLFVVPTFLVGLIGFADARSGQSLMLGLFGALNTATFEPWALLTSNFLHATALHLLFNMIALFQIGRFIQEYYGGRLLLIFYIISGIAGSLATVIFIPQNVVSVGASGAVFGLAGVLLAGAFKKNRFGVDLPISVGSILPFVIYSLLIGFSIPNVNNAAHIGGLITGIALGWIFEHKLTSAPALWKQIFEKWAFIATVVLMVLSYLVLILRAAAVLYQF